MARRGRITRPLTIREYKDSDEAQIVELVRELQVHETPFNEKSKPPEAIGPWYVAEVKKWCVKHEGTILVVEGGGKLLGYATMLSHCKEDGTSDEVAHSYALIADLVATNSAGRQGIGKTLLDACEAIARKCGQNDLRIGVLAANEGAGHTYRDFGFTEHHLTLKKKLS